MAKKIKVGFDISQLAHKGGVNTYTRNLTEELSKIDDLEMTYFYSSLRQPYKGDLKDVKKFKIPPTFFEVLFNRMRNVSIERFIGDVDIFHSSDWAQPPGKSLKVTTYHDVIPLKFPKWSHPKIVQVHKRRLELVEKEIDMVIAVSETTKKDLLEISKIPEDKIVVILEGVEERFKPQPEDKVKSFKEKYNLPAEFVLAMGGVGERKNLKRIKEACKDYNLIIPGENIPYVSNEELPLLYCSAKVLLYATLYEGFGLPVVEAMACGLPFIVSNAEWSNELMDYPGLFTDPKNVDDMKIRLKQAMDSDYRANLIKNGLKRAGFFSWQKAAAETAEVYRKLMK